MSLDRDSRYARTVVIAIVDARGLPVQPPYLDLLPRLNRVDYADNRYVTVGPADDWGTLGVAALGDARKWWALAEMSGIVDPLAELIQGLVLTAPSLATLHFLLEHEEGAV